MGQYFKLTKGTSPADSLSGCLWLTESIVKIKLYMKKGSAPNSAFCHGDGDLICRPSTPVWQGRIGELKDNYTIKLLYAEDIP